AGWLSSGEQPLPRQMYGDLRAFFPSAVDVPYVKKNSVQFLGRDDRSDDPDQPSTAHYCATFQFLRKVKPTPIPYAVSGAPVSEGSLVVRGDCNCPPSPAASCVNGFDKGLLFVDETTSGKEKLLVEWVRGPQLAGT